MRPSSRPKQHDRPAFTQAGAGVARCKMHQPQSGATCS
ncbi:Hypothetical protein A7982_08423 [Minicystis rosea]|nr:Hypothetical protein A7982_08423 [Minicystis rosea]